MGTATAAAEDMYLRVQCSDTHTPTPSLYQPLILPLNFHGMLLCVLGLCHNTSPSRDNIGSALGLLAPCMPCLALLAKQCFHAQSGASLRGLALVSASSTSTGRGAGQIQHETTCSCFAHCAKRALLQPKKPSGQTGGLQGGLWSTHA